MDTGFEVRSANQFNPERKETTIYETVPSEQESGNTLASWSPEEDFDALTDRDFYPDDLASVREQKIDQMRRMYPNLQLEFDPTSEDDYEVNKLIGVATVGAYGVLT